jgi:hypothetical protein
LRLPGIPEILNLPLAILPSILHQPPKRVQMAGANHVYRKSHDTFVPVVVGASHEPTSVFGIQCVEPISMQCFREAGFSSPRLDNLERVSEGFPFVMNDTQSVDERGGRTEIDYRDFAVKISTTLTLKELPSQYDLVRISKQLWDRAAERLFIHCFLPFLPTPGVLGGSQGVGTPSLGAAA